MRKFIITLLFLLPVQAFAGECVVSSSSNKPDARGGLLAALAKVQTGKCETSDEFYRETYGRHFPGSTNYQVVIWKTSMNIELADSLPAISSQSGDPIILRAIDGANVHLKGNGSAKGLKLKDDMIVIENLQISNFAQAGVAMSGEKNIIIASNIHHNKGSGVVLKGKSNKIYSSTIAYNGHSGVELGDEESSSYCQPQSMRILQKTILANNLIHHNEANGLSVDAFSVVVEGGKIHHNGENGIVVNTIGSKIRCQDEGVAIKRADLKTANISKVALYDNEQEQLHISDYPLSAVKNLAISGANSSGSFTVSGLLSFSNDKQMPWHGEVIDFSSLRVDLYLGDENSGGKIYLASAQLAGSSSERFSVELNSEAAEKIQGHTKLVAIVVDTEFGHTSELSASHNIANVSAEADRMDIADDDQDGLANDREDFDGDGFVDRDAGETDPFNPDSDGDGLTDGEERDHIDRIAVLIEQGFPFAALDRLDPNNSDSDGDCLPDGLEVGISKVIASDLLDRMPARPSLDLAPDCLNSLSKLGVSLSWALPIDPALDVSIIKKDLPNIAMLYDLDPETQTDPTSDDSDDDGMQDGKEDWNFDGQRNQSDLDLWLETDPMLPDSDEDGIPDGDEGDKDGNGEYDADESSPLKRDSDGDGVDDGMERRIGTRVGLCDSDNDGLSDGVEMQIVSAGELATGCHGLLPAGSNYALPNKLDPKNPDSDADGILDGAEDANSNGWVDPNESDPSIVDTDKDGLADGVEMRGDYNADGIPDFDVRQVLGGGHACNPPQLISDIDCDGVPNFRDDDSDGDGCADIDEASWNDLNNNGIPDVYDPAAKSCASSGGQVSFGGGGSFAGTSNDTQEEKPAPVAAKFSQTPLGNYTAGGACSLFAHSSRVNAASEGIILACLLFLLGYKRQHEN